MPLSIIELSHKNFSLSIILHSVILVPLYWIIFFHCLGSFTGIKCKKKKKKLLSYQKTHVVVYSEK